MSKESIQQRLMGDQVLAKVTRVSATYSMSINDHLVIVGSNPGNFTITLPSVSEAAGRIYEIQGPTVGSDSDAITVQDLGGDAGFGDLTIDADLDYTVLYSNGLQWRVLKDGIA